MPIRTFVDANVLIAASIGNRPTSDDAFAIIDDPNREFVANDYLWLETVPKPMFNGQKPQAEFVEEFLAGVVAHADPSVSLMEGAKRLALRYGLSGLDALHVQTAIELGADEFVTGERKKVLSRIKEIKVVQLGD